MTLEEEEEKSIKTLLPTNVKKCVAIWSLCERPVQLENKPELTLENKTELLCSRGRLYSRARLDNIIDVMGLSNLCVTCALQ